MKVFATVLFCLSLHLLVVKSDDELPILCRTQQCPTDRPDLWCTVDTPRYSEKEACKAVGFSTNSNLRPLPIFLLLKTRGQNNKTTTTDLNHIGPHTQHPQKREVTLAEKKRKWSICSVDVAQAAVMTTIPPIVLQRLTIAPKRRAEGSTDCGATAKEPCLVTNAKENPLDARTLRSGCLKLAANAKILAVRYYKPLPYTPTWST